jgi:hypothetical protein
MEVKINPEAGRYSMLDSDEMKSIRGGGLYDNLMKFVIWGVTYCYNMGVQEARRMKAQL